MPLPDQPPLDKTKLMPGAEYRLTKAFYADDTYIAEGEIIQMDGIPNECMEPRNEAARANLELFFKHNGGKTPELSEVAEQAMKDRPKEEAKTVNVVSKPAMIPLTGGIQAEGLPAQKPKPATVKHIQTPEVPKFVRPIAQQGTVDPGGFPGKGSI